MVEVLIYQEGGAVTSGVFFPTFSCLLISFSPQKSSRRYYYSLFHSLIPLSRPEEKGEAFFEDIIPAETMVISAIRKGRQECYYRLCSRYFLFFPSIYKIYGKKWGLMRVWLWKNLYLLFRKTFDTRLRAPNLWLTRTNITSGLQKRCSFSNFLRRWW